MQVFVLHILQTILGALSRAFPGLAAKIAWYPLIHPGLFKLRTSVENELLERAELLKAQADELSVVTSQGSMRVYHWMPEETGRKGAPVAILVHGWGGCGLYMTQFVTPLLDAGYQVAAIDLPGHGASSGASTDVANAAELIIASARALGRSDLLLGHSFGAIAVMAAIAGGAPLHDKIAAKKLVLLSAPTSLESIIVRVGRLLDLSKPAQGKLIEIAENNLGAGIAAVSAQSLLDRIACPVLAIHDGDDAEIPLTDSLVDTVKKKRLKTLTTSGLGHRKILLSPEIINAVAKFAARK